MTREYLTKIISHYENKIETYKILKRNYRSYKKILRKAKKEYELLVKNETLKQK